MDMENGFIGMDPELARRNIEDFRNAMEQVELHYTIAINRLFEDLSKTWASLRAVDFFNEYRPKVNDVSTLIWTSKDSISQGAVRAYNSMANAVGERLITDEYYDDNATYATEMPLAVFVDNIAGKVGMNVNLVKNDFLPAFEKSVELIYECIDNVPNSIALYDDESLQSGTYATNVTNVKNNISELVEDIKLAISAAILKESDNIMLAKQQSVNQMNA